MENIDLKTMSQNIVNILKSGINSKDYNYIQKNVVQILNNYKPSITQETANLGKVIKKYYDKIPAGYDIELLTENFSTYLDDLECNMESYIEYGENDVETVNQIKSNCKNVIKSIADSEKEIKRLMGIKNQCSSFLKEIETAQKKDKETKQKNKKK